MCTHADEGIGIDLCSIGSFGVVWTEVNRLYTVVQSTRIGITPLSEFNVNFAIGLSLERFVADIGAGDFSVRGSVFGEC